MIKKEIVLGEKLFEFTSFENWCDTAQKKFKKTGLRPGYASLETVCIDQKGRVCSYGKQFVRARDDNSFPIEVFLIE